MLGYLLLFLAIVLYFVKEYRYFSIFLLIGFLSGLDGGYGLLTEQIIGVNTSKLAFFYLLFIGIYDWRCLFFNTIIPKKIRNASFAFILFIVCSCIVSYCYYGVSVYEIFSTAYPMSFVLFLFILTKLKDWEIKKIVVLLFYLTFLQAILFICQSFTGVSLMPYRLVPAYYSEFHLYRFYNFPPFLLFFCCYSFMVTRQKIFRMPVLLVRFIFVIASLCTLGRTYIFVTLLLIFYSKVLKKRNINVFRTFFVAILLLLLLFPYLNDVIGADTYGDMSAVLNGKFETYYGSAENATMSYRFLWISERLDYMLKKPISMLFGLGYIQEGSPLCTKLYNFMIGLRDENSGLVTQLVTPDIAYGNFLTRFGLLGTFLYMYMLIQIFILFEKYKQYNDFYNVCFIVLTMSLVNSFSSSDISSVSYMMIFYLFSIYLLKTSYKYG